MHDCPDTCAWTVTTENGRAIGLVADSLPTPTTLTPRAHYAKRWTATLPTSSTIPIAFCIL